MKLKIKGIEYKMQSKKSIIFKKFKIVIDVLR